MFLQERSKKRLDGWFLAREIVYKNSDKLSCYTPELRAAYELKAIIKELPLSISEFAVFAGTQSDSFARSYALINPAFKVETFSGYCDPTAVYSDIEPNDDITRERIDEVLQYTKNSEYVKKLSEVYSKYNDYTQEVSFFIEQVTGHLIPDFRPAIAFGVDKLISEINEKISTQRDKKKKDNLEAMKISLECVKILATRYADIACEMKKTAGSDRKKQLELLEQTLRRVPAHGATSLYEAIQVYMLLWQVMCLEQAPNPFAFSVGNADRIFEPYRNMENLDRKAASELLQHFLVFFNVGDRSWAISQNIIIGGKSSSGLDLTNETSYALLDAYYDMNLPQPILSVKLHKNTSQKLYEELGRFFFTPGCLTPSIFNDDAMFEVLKKTGCISQNDLEDYSIAGCQEPLIMGKDNGNTTNSWLNLPKILELTLNNGYSTLTGKRIDSRCFI